MNVLEANLLEKYPELEIRSVDGFQGREKEVVILSLVRSNINKNLGFIVEKRRLNVGVTRARRQLVLVCDSSTVGQDEFLGKFVTYMRENGVVEEASTLETKHLVLPRRGLVSSDQRRKVGTIVKKKETNSVKLGENKKLPSLGRVAGIECEMVGVGDGGVESVLARVSIVDGTGKQILDKYVATEEVITDYRTEKSGIRRQHLVGAPAFDIVRSEVMALLKDKIIVGHGLDHDFEVLDYYPPKLSIRDTADYFSGFKKKCKTPSLKFLARTQLGKKIQSGEHDSVEDARTALKLYLKVREDWEPRVQSKGKHSKTKKSNTAGSNVKVEQLNKKASVNEISKKLSGLSIQEKKEKPTKTKKLKSKVNNSGTTGTCGVDKFKRLKTLSPGHTFTEDDFTAILRTFGNVLWYQRKEKEIEWSKTWLAIRQDLPKSKYYAEMSIMDAFNNLSNCQLRLWLQYREKKMNQKKI